MAKKKTVLTVEITPSEKMTPVPPMKLTALEIQVMTLIPEDNFYEEGFDSILWNDCFIDTTLVSHGLDPKQVRGVLSSLKKKKALVICPEGKDSTICLGDLGKEWLIENELVDLNGRPLKYGPNAPVKTGSNETPNETASAPKKDLTADLAAATGSPIRTRRNTITLAAKSLAGQAYEVENTEFDWKLATDRIITTDLEYLVPDEKKYKALRRAIRREALTLIGDPVISDRLKLK